MSVSRYIFSYANFIYMTFRFFLFTQNLVSLAISKEAQNYRDLTITDFSNWVCLPMSVRLSLTPSWILQLSGNNGSVSIGVFHDIVSIIW